MAVYGLGLLSLVPGLVVASRRGSLALAVRLTYSGLVLVLLFFNPVPTVWIFTLPGLIPLISRRLWAGLVSLIPAGALAAMGGVAWQRGAARGLWLQPWQLGALGLALALVWFLPRRRAGARRRVSARRGLPS
jgi:hypothetical protein